MVWLGTSCADRDTKLGSTINAYLTKEVDVDDHAIHLIFSANRWERRCVHRACKPGAMRCARALTALASILVRVGGG
ncbi:hypothetical protein EON66_02085 [archaeon]|nr:MAG: hypothetical protein EON66_02085 [archaeon]